MLEEQAAEEAREHPHGQEESGPTGDPLRAIGRQAAARDHTVQMGMIDERLAPRVEHGEEPNLGAEMCRIGGDGA